jgi:two-component system, cell cycle response regulator DivK
MEPEPRSPEQSSSRPRRRRRPTTRPPVILIADDTTDSRDLYTEYFEARGFSVVTARDGANAVEVALEHVPEVIVMDLAMPQIDGITAIQRIKADARMQQTRVILLTGYHFALERSALEAGADLFLRKPCLPERLESHVNALRQERGPGGGTPAT